MPLVRGPSMMVMCIKKTELRRAQFAKIGPNCCLEIKPITLAQVAFAGFLAKSLYLNWENLCTRAEQEAITERGYA